MARVALVAFSLALLRSVVVVDAQGGACQVDADCNYANGYCAGENMCFCLNGYTGAYCESPPMNPTYSPTTPTMNNHTQAPTNAMYTPSPTPYYAPTAYNGHWFERLPNNLQHSPMCENGQDYIGLPGDDPKLCQTLCAIRPGCTGFNWVPLNFTCHLVSDFPIAPLGCPAYQASASVDDYRVGWIKHEATRSPGSAPEEIQGYHWVMSTGKMKHDVKCENGRNFFGIPGETNELCDKMCATLPTCQGYNWVPSELSCKLVSYFPFGPAGCPAYLSQAPIVDKEVGWEKDNWQDQMP
jgi:hypothetical protein